MHRRVRERAWLLWRRLAELGPGAGRGEQKGQDLVEYALIIGFIAVACAALIPYTSTATMRAIYSRIAEILTNSTTQT